MHTKWIAIGIVSLTVAAAPAQLRPAREHFVVPAEQVARAIVASFAERGIQISEDQVTLPVTVLATEAAPALEVSAIHSLGRLSLTEPGQGSTGIRLKCKTSATCMPFYAVVTWPENQTSATPRVVAAALPLPAESRSAKIIKAGARLTMVMEADHARISMEVISLGSAALGQQLRVSTPDHKHIYVAEVLGANLVRGSF